MALPSQTTRCPHCGRAVVVPVPPGPAPSYWSCPTCGHPIAVFPVRDPPPLFTWEVFPGLYPAVRPPPRPDPRVGRFFAALFVAGVVLLAALASATAAEGAIAFGPGPFAVQGTVEALSPTGGVGASLSPLAGALVTVTPESGGARTMTTGDTGQFEFAGLPPGREVVNISASGYSSASYLLFLSAAFSSEGSPSDPLLVTLSTGNGSASSSTETLSVQTPFYDLENLVASLWSSTVLLALGALVAGFGAFAAVRRTRPGLAMAGAVATAVSPIPMFAFAIGSAMPWIGALAAVTVALGIVVASFQGMRMALQGRLPEPERPA